MYHIFFGKYTTNLLRNNLDLDWDLNWDLDLDLDWDLSEMESSSGGQHTDHESLPLAFHGTNEPPTALGQAGALAQHQVATAFGQIPAEEVVAELPVQVRII